MAAAFGKGVPLEELFGNPFLEKRERVNVEEEGATRYCIMMDEMIGSRTRPWNPQRMPIKPVQVEETKKNLTQGFIEFAVFAPFDKFYSRG
uniref:Uncharacterized protein n=1 Tax=Parascaris equorum TaxID=6256 RepID=A0A914RI12_PAREQ